MYQARVTLPSPQGEFTLNLECEPYAQHLSQYGDNTHTVTVTVLAWISLLADSEFDMKPRRVYTRFATSLTRDFRGTVRSYAQLADELVKTLDRPANGPFQEPYLQEFERTPVYREYAEFRKTHSPRVLQYLLTFLWFGKKAHYKDESLEATALCKWLEIEENLKNLVLPAFVANLKTICYWLFESWQPGPFLPKNGSGAVAEVGYKSVNRKCDQVMIRDERLYRTFVDGYLSTPSYGSCLPGVSLPHSEGPVMNQARLMFVPKDYKSVRSICMEPAARMWAQQGVLQWFEHFFESSRLSRHIHLSDQRVNQQGSMLGSKSGLLDTLDLSSASDSVAWKVLKAILPPHVLRYLSATRTATVLLPDGTHHRMEKFAPMGSALCFPVQCTVFSAIITMVAIGQMYGLDLNNPDALADLDLDIAYELTFARTKGNARQYHPFLVYGDDMITDHRITSNVMSALEELGFVVNTKKSFIGRHPFRESCGEFHYFGERVTPFMFKIKEIENEVSIASYAGLIDQANQTAKLGYTFLRRTLVQAVLRYPVAGLRKTNSGLNPVLFSSDRESSLAIHSDTCRNSHLRKRKWSSTDSTEDKKQDLTLEDCMSMSLTAISKYATAGSSTHKALQRAEYRCISLEPDEVEVIDPKWENYRYLVWWRSRPRGVGLESNSMPLRVDSKNARFRWAWKPSG